MWDVLESIGHGISNVWHSIVGGGDAPAPAASGDAGHGAAQGGLAPEAQKLADEANSKAAHDLLAQKMKVMDDPSGEHKPNEVSKEEFEKMASLYANLLGNKTNVTFDATGAKDPAAFKQAALGDIANMMSTTAGRTLLDQMVKPDDKDGKDTAMPFHIKYTDNKFGGNANREWDYDNNKFKDEVYVQYAAGTEKDDGMTHYTGDSTLFHEMTHALHHRDGTAVAASPDHQVNPVDARDTGVQQEEYNTVGLDHDGHQVATVVNGVEISEREYRKEMAANGRGIGDRPRYNACEGGVCPEAQVN